MSSLRTVGSMVAAAAALSLTTAPAHAQESGCVTAANPASLAGRPSPLDSLTFQVSGQAVKVCYGRPAARGRTMIGGGAVPFGTLWRTGANEPTMIHTPVPLMIAGVHVQPGTYSLYSVPNESQWEIIVNRAYAQWGHEGQYTADVKAQEVGRGMAPVTETENHIEQFTINFRRGHLVFQWENTAVRIPVSGM